ncbi:hypothetical protein [Candidatus Cardinium sp. cByotN1]|uniref:hypothetical protein n=1 Tax=Candidatus Cardinium sp. cByotN1 TaxID=2699439 RepID=UPI001FB39139|nr:hypothetical protein [Candidatus Cardinium sp. cByotN1]
MRYIKNLCKILALFCLTTVFSQGCKCSSNKDKSPTESPKVESLIQQPVISTAQTESPENDENDENDEKPQINLLEQPFMPTPSAPPYPTAGTESEDSSKEEIKKIFETKRKETINQYETQLRSQTETPSPEQRLSEDQIEQLIKAEWDRLYAIDKKRLKLPFKQLKALADSIQAQAELVKDIHEVYQEKLGLLGQKATAMMSADNANQIKIEINPSQPIFQQLINVIKEQYKLIEDGLKLANHEHRVRARENQNYSLAFYQKMENAFLECSAQEKKYYEPHLKNFVQLLQSELQESQKINEIMRHSLGEEIQKITLETKKKMHAIITPSANPE